MRGYIIFLIKSVAALLLVGVVGVAAVVGYFVWHYGYAIDLPDPRKLATASAGESSCVRGDGERTFVSLDAIPPLVRNAFLAAEDPDFYDRSPINPLTQFVAAALFDRAPHGSTISSEVTRCLVMSSGAEWGGKTFDWHISNAILIHRVESDLSKDRIFEVYLNEVFLGRRAFGVSAAAKTYFGKSISQLTIDEAAYLAALARAPSLFGRDTVLAFERRNFVIGRMAEVGAISPAEAASAKQQPLIIK
jgi:penicillin-binding protein 1A